MSNRLRVMLSKVIAGLRGHADGELAAEVAHHLALLEERYLARGMTPDDARREARRAFGGVQQLTEEHREVRSFVWLDHLRQDYPCGCHESRLLSGAILRWRSGSAPIRRLQRCAWCSRSSPTRRIQRIGWDWNGRGQVKCVTLAP